MAANTLFRAALLTLGLSFQGCLQTNGEVSNCDTTLPKAKSIDPDSLLLVPFTYTHLSVGNDSTRKYGYRTLGLVFPGRDSSNAFIHLDSNGLGLTLDGRPVEIPPPAYTGGDGWHCPAYSEWKTLVLPGDGRDTAFRLDIRKDSLTLRSWTVAFRFDDAKAPAMKIERGPEGFTVGIPVVPGLRPGTLYLGETYGGWADPLATGVSGGALSSPVAFKNLPDLNKARYASEIGAHYELCLDYETGLESVTVDGATRETPGEYCQQLPAEVEADIVAYRRKKCLDCR